MPRVFRQCYTLAHLLLFEDVRMHNVRTSGMALSNSRSAALAGKPENQNRMAPITVYSMRYATETSQSPLVASIEAHGQTPGPDNALGVLGKWLDGICAIDWLGAGLIILLKPAAAVAVD